MPREVMRGDRDFLYRSLVLGACAASLLGLAGCQSKGAAAPAMGPVPVTVTEAQQQDVNLKGEWVGTLDGYTNAQIQPQVTGYLISQDYKEGSVVSKGQILFHIDPRPFQASVDQAAAQVDQAKGQLAQSLAARELAQINVNRDTPLAAAKAIAQSQLDTENQTLLQDDASVAASKASIEAAQASLQTAKINLGFTQVRSLITGIAGAATTQVGNLVSTQSTLTSVSTLDPIKVFFSISDSEYLGLVERAKQKGTDLLDSKMPLTLTLANGQKYDHPGKIVFVDRQMNQQTGAIRIAAAFPNPGNVLRPGQFGRVSAETEVQHDVLLVPQLAVQELQGIEQVYTVSPQGTVHVVNVTLGPQYGNNWIVTGGLTPGTKIILDNLQKLKEGVPVSPHQGEPPAVTSMTGSQGAGR
ncbi:efflux RND transporter periplasmic adaptor subunit [Silvibacterium dinghuense]|uniref:Efflux RND transporter periplasmic adaptor subunit n=2 Tax=Silvibacterium dinghuense TaxID=1560006 RepID=A0A4Q1SLE8_9BACT|nr:efflux RND transporter periplasmic adaptor subunit [Silvibacterium dinghuense]